MPAHRENREEVSRDFPIKRIFVVFVKFISIILAIFVLNGNGLKSSFLCAYQYPDYLVGCQQLIAGHYPNITWGDTAALLPGAQTGSLHTPPNL
jgi:hypothetical protein